MFVDQLGDDSRVRVVPPQPQTPSRSSHNDHDNNERSTTRTGTTVRVTVSGGCPLSADAWDGKMLRPSADGALPGSTMLVLPGRC